MNIPAIYSPVRLAELSVYNWGSFHNLHTAHIHPEGSLITGGNGAGKSTLADGLMALLLPARQAAFNLAAAQGDKTDRSLLSYMRGHFGADHDGLSTRRKSKRDGAVITGLRALYRADDGSETTLAALFWTPPGGSSLSDVKRLYLVSRHNLSLSELLLQFGNGDLRALNRWLKSQPDIKDFDKFETYQTHYRRCLHMENENAPALLSRALGLKKIDDLTKLIRELVLEPSAIRSEAAKIIDEFQDLAAIHEQAADARKQLTHLEPLPGLQAKIAQAGEAIHQLNEQRSHIPAYFARCRTRFLAQETEKLSGSLHSLKRQINDTERTLADAQHAQEQRHAEYLHAGGGRLQALENQLKLEEAQLQHTRHTADAYQKICLALNLPDTLAPDIFERNLHTAAGQQPAVENQLKAQQERFFQSGVQLSQLQTSLREIETELHEIGKRPNSNIPPKQQQWRDNVAQDLGIPPQELMFIGEMLDIVREHADWTGAIERALGGLRTTLLVPQEQYPRITRWLNQCHTGLHIRVQAVGSETKPAAFKSGGILEKLLWRNHPYCGWLQGYLKKADLYCAEDLDSFNRTPFSLTRQGLQHWEHGRAEKKDQTRIDDPRHWFLGFTNATRLGYLKTEQTSLQAKLLEQTRQVEHERAEMNRVQQQQVQWQNLQTYQWHDIDLPYRQQKLAHTQADLARLKQSGGNLQQAEQRWQQAKHTVAQLKTALGQQQQQEGYLKNKLDSLQSEFDSLQELAQQPIPEAVLTALTDAIEEAVPQDSRQQSRVLQSYEQRIEQARQQKTRDENSANGIMISFRSNERWQPYTLDWPTAVHAALPEYIPHLNYIRHEGLPDLVERQAERVSKYSTQSLATLLAAFNTERDTIRERIQKINQVLAKTEFRPGSYLRLRQRDCTNLAAFDHVRNFHQKANAALAQITGSNHDLRFQMLAGLIEILKKHTASPHNLESLRLLDPRYRLEFFAEETNLASGEVLDVLDSSGGKSGGEKEAFAGIIVAASLAYVLTPDGCDYPVYRTVFLDEAFSNTAEAVSRRVLRVFKELHIHVNLITPYKNLNLARESAKSLVIAERNAEKHESSLCEMTWEELDRQQQERFSGSLLQEAEQLGIHSL